MIDDQQHYDVLQKSRKQINQMLRVRLLREGPSLVFRTWLVAVRGQGEGPDRLGGGDMETDDMVISRPTCCQ